MAKALAFGTFDVLHPGHLHYLKTASTYGELTVIVARDATVLNVKGRPPLKNEAERLRDLQAAGYRAVLGSEGDKYAVIAAERPDAICLGYDQTAFTEGLEAACRAIGLRARIVRIPAFHPERYKSSLLNRYAHADRNDQSGKGERA